MALSARSRSVSGAAKMTIAVILAITASAVTSLSDESAGNPATEVGYRPEIPMRDFSEYQPYNPGPLQDEPSLTPDTLFVTLNAGEAVVEDKLLHIPSCVPPRIADILFVLDLTGSMEEELLNVKLNAIDIMAELRDLIPDTHFGVISHMDYVGYYDFCQYSNEYGVYGDYPYSLDQPITSDMSAVQNAINSLALGAGADAPESYARALYECYSDGAVGWRDSSKKFIVLFGDDLPHDCEVLACIGETATTGRDPGRNGLLDDADDIFMGDVISGLVSNNILLVPLYSGDVQNHYYSWDCWAGITGGYAFLINPDGTVPGGLNIAEYIVEALGQIFCSISRVTLRVCAPGYEDWLVNVDPPSYTDLSMEAAHDLEFQVTIQIPEGADCGSHSFDICADVDGAIYASQYVRVFVEGSSGAEPSTWGRIKAGWRE